MLIEFSVENFLSFKDKVTLSMVASKDDDLSSNVIYNAGGTNLNLLRSAVIFGPNAAGKSNLVKALAFFKNAISDEQDYVGTLQLSDFQNQQRQPFNYRLERKWEVKPTRFSAMFIMDGTRYEYGFSLKKGKVVEEHLSSFPTGRERFLFVRNHEKKDGSNPFDFSRAYFKGPTKSLIPHTRDDALFLKVASTFNNNTARKVVDWFTSSFRLLPNEPMIYKMEGQFQTKKLALEDRKAKEVLVKMLANADPSIENLRIVRGSPDLKADFLEIYSAKIKALLATQFNDVLSLRAEIFHRGEERKPGKNPIVFGLESESEGTQKIFAFFAKIFNSLKHGQCLIADELDLHLHTLLTRWLIKMFHEPGRVDKGAQLILTTHDTQLLDRTIFRRDQIWLLDREKGGASDLYSIWEFKDVRKEDNVGKKYLAGRFGAIPSLDVDMRD